MDDALEKGIPELETDKQADPLQQEIDPLRLATSRGHGPGPRRGAGRGRTPVPRAPPAQAASQPMPPLPLEIVGPERPRRACSQEGTTSTKRKK